MVEPGDRVQILYPEYAVGHIGIVLEPEILQDGTLTGYWLVQVEGEEAVLALQPSEIQVLAKVSDGL